MLAVFGSAAQSTEKAPARKSLEDVLATFAAANAVTLVYDARLDQALLAQSVSEPATFQKTDLDQLLAGLGLVVLKHNDTVWRVLADPRPVFALEPYAIENESVSLRKPVSVPDVRGLETAGDSSALGESLSDVVSGTANLYGSAGSIFVRGTARNNPLGTIEDAPILFNRQPLPNFLLNTFDPGIMPDDEVAIRRGGNSWSADANAAFAGGIGLRTAVDAESGNRWVSRVSDDGSYGASYRYAYQSQDGGFSGVAAAGQTSVALPDPADGNKEMRRIDMGMRWIAPVAPFDMELRLSHLDGTSGGDAWIVGVDDRMRGDAIEAFADASAQATIVDAALTWQPSDEWKTWLDLGWQNATGDQNDAPDADDFDDFQETYRRHSQVALGVEHLWSDSTSLHVTAGLVRTEDQLALSTLSSFTQFIPQSNYIDVIGDAAFGNRAEVDSVHDRQYLAMGFSHQSASWEARVNGRWERRRRTDSTDFSHLYFAQGPCEVHATRPLTLFGVPMTRETPLDCSVIAEALGSFVNPPEAQSARWEFAPELAFGWTAPRSSDVWVRYYEGFRPGGVVIHDDIVESTAYRFAEERSRTLEAIWEADWADWGVSHRATLFYSRFSDQHGEDLTTGSIVNLGQSHAYGLEWEGTWRPGDRQRWDWSLGLLETHVERSSEPGLLGPEPGDAFIAAPPWSASITYSVDVGQHSQITARAVAYPDVESDPSNDDTFRTEGYRLLNLAYRYEQPSYFYEIYVKNLTDEQYLQTVSSPLDSGDLLVRPALGRQVGFGFGINF